MNTLSSHLYFSNQTYIEHFKDSIKYSIKSFKAGIYFLIHAFVPDLCVSSGSEEIHEIELLVRHKYEQINNDY